MVTLGTGVGGGVVLNGKVLMGESGVAGEIGHMTVNPFETVRCNCGKAGCLEQYASATGMVRVAKQVLAKRREDSLLRQKEVTAKTLWDAARAGDALANEITDAVSAYLGMALANAMYLVDTEKIVFGGGVSKAGELLLQKVEKACRYYHCRRRIVYEENHTALGDARRRGVGPLGIPDFRKRVPFLFSDETFDNTLLAHVESVNVYLVNSFSDVGNDFFIRSALQIANCNICL